MGNIDPTHPPALKARKSVAAVVAIKVIRRGWGGKGWGCNPQGSFSQGDFFHKRLEISGEVFPFELS